MAENLKTLRQKRRVLNLVFNFSLLVKTMEPLNRMKLERDCAEIRDELEFKYAQIRDSLSSLQKKVDAKVSLFFHPQNN